MCVIVGYLGNRQATEVLVEVLSKLEYRGYDLAGILAMEGALKIKETSYVYAEAFASEELKHGSIALIDKGTPVVAIASQGVLFKKWFQILKKLELEEI